MAGYGLFRKYRSQFGKILNVICESYLGALKARDDPELNPVIAEIQSYVEDKKFLQVPEGKVLQGALLSREMVPESDYRDSYSYPPNRYYYWADELAFYWLQNCRKCSCQPITQSMLSGCPSTRISWLHSGLCLHVSVSIMYIHWFMYSSVPLSRTLCLSSLRWCRPLVTGICLWLGSRGCSFWAFLVGGQFFSVFIF